MVWSPVRDEILSMMHTPLDTIAPASDQDCAGGRSHALGAVRG